MRPEVNCFFSVPFKGACFSELRERLPRRWRSVSYPGVACVKEQAGMFNATFASEGPRPISAG